MPIDLTDIQFALKTISSYAEIELNEDTPIKEFGFTAGMLKGALAKGRVGK